MTLRENLAPNDFSELSEDPLIDFANNFPDRLNTFLGALDSKWRGIIWWAMEKNCTL